MSVVSAHVGLGHSDDESKNRDISMHGIAFILHLFMINFSTKKKFSLVNFISNSTLANTTPSIN